MAGPDGQSARIWALVRRQHGVVTRAQLLALGLSGGAIDHRLASGRLHVLHRSVYAVGRPGVTQLGRWMATVLSCGRGAALSHSSASALWGIGPPQPVVHVSVPAANRHRPAGIRLHRRSHRVEVTVHRGIPVTRPVETLIDIACEASRGELERAVNEADGLGLVDPEALRAALEGMPPRRGVGVLRTVLDRRTFTFTRSELERRFLPIAAEAGLPMPQTNVRVNGFEVDFYWPELGLVVEADGLTYHRTPAQQARDRLRDQTHTAAGLIALRFTHAQIRYGRVHVRRTLVRTAARLAA